MKDLETSIAEERAEERKELVESIIKKIDEAYTKKLQDTFTEILYKALNIRRLALQIDPKKFEQYDNTAMDFAMASTYASDICNIIEKLDILPDERLQKAKDTWNEIKKDAKAKLNEKCIYPTSETGA